MTIYCYDLSQQSAAFQTIFEIVAHISLMFNENWAMKLEWR